jgi:hypothetical protein
MAGCDTGASAVACGLPIVGLAAAIAVIVLVFGRHVPALFTGARDPIHATTC